MSSKLKSCINFTKVKIYRSIFFHKLNKQKKFLNAVQNIVVVFSVNKYDESFKKYVENLIKNEYRVLFVVFGPLKPKENNIIIDFDIYQISYSDYRKMNYDFRKIDKKVIYLNDLNKDIVKVALEKRLSHFYLHYDLNNDQLDNHYVEQMINNADLVTCSSKKDIDKYSYLRKDLVIYNSFLKDINNYYKSTSLGDMYDY